MSRNAPRKSIVHAFLAKAFILSAFLPYAYGIHARRPIFEDRKIGTTTFSPARRDYFFGQSPVAAEIFDYNADGAIDVAALVTGNAGEVNVLEGSHSGFFQLAWAAGVGDSPRDIAVMEVNGDSLPDLVVACGADGFLQIFLGNPADIFSYGASVDAGTEPSLLEVKDLTGDLEDELLLVSTSELFVFARDGGEGLMEIFHTLLASLPKTLHAADFDGDGFADVVLAYEEGGIELYPGDGSGALGPAIPLDNSQVVSLASADIDFDGNMDILSVDALGGELCLLWGDGNGEFRPSRYEYEGFTASRVIPGPLGSRGLLDVISVSEESGGILAHEGRVCGIAGSMELQDAPGSGEQNSHSERRAFCFDQKGEEYRCGEATVAAFSADADGEGTPDLIAMNFDSFSLSLFYGAGQGLYYSAPNFPAAAGGEPGAKSVAVLDANEDGHEDIAVSFMWNDSVSVLLGDGLGNLSRHALFPVGGTGVHSLAAADMNADGHEDLVVRNVESSSVSVLLGDGDGNFELVGAFPTGLGTHFVSIVDLDLDGDLDVITPNARSGNVSVLLGDGTGSLTHTDLIPVGRGPHACVPLDFQPDGFPDLAVANTGEDSVAFLENRSGSLVLVGKLEAGVGPISITAGDFNEDGTTDLATANFAGLTVSVLTGMGGGAFAWTQDLFAGRGPHYVITEDIDGDGHMDLASAVTGQDAVLLLFGEGDGTFPRSEYHGVHDNPNAVASCDVNEDGLPDLVTANVGSHDVTLLLGARGTAPLEPS